MAEKQKEANIRKAKILLYSTNIWYFGEGMLGPLLAIFTEQIGGDILDVAWAWSIFLIVTGVATIGVGYISDMKKGINAKLMIAGYALNAVFTFGFLFVENSNHLFIVEAGLGLAAALATPTWDVLYEKYQDKRHPGLAWGEHDGLAKIMTGVAIVFGGFLLSRFSFDTLFLTMGVIQTVAFTYQSTIFFRDRY